MPSKARDYASVALALITPPGPLRTDRKPSPLGLSPTTVPVLPQVSVSADVDRDVHSGAAKRRGGRGEGNRYRDG